MIKKKKRKKRTLKQQKEINQKISASIRKKKYDDINKMLKEGYSHRQIAVKLSCSNTTIQKAIKYEKYPVISIEKEKKITYFLNTKES